MTKHIGLPTAKKLVKTAIKQKGEDYYPEGTCCYFDDEGTPECIVGVALASEGLSYDNIMSLGDVQVAAAQMLSKTTARANICKIRDLAEHLAPFGFTFSKAAVKYLDVVQMYQDQGQNWTNAAQLAENYKNL